jgi:hypothetical protein
MLSDASPAVVQMIRYPIPNSPRFRGLFMGRPLDTHSVLGCLRELPTVLGRSLDISIFGQPMGHMFLGQSLDNALIAMKAVGQATHGGASGSSDPHTIRHVSHGSTKGSNDPHAFGRVSYGRARLPP